MDSAMRGGFGGESETICQSYNCKSPINPDKSEDAYGEPGHCIDCIEESYYAYNRMLMRNAAESKKINPLEKAGLTGVASGATMEGLELALSAEGSLSKCHVCGMSNDDASIDECRVCKNGFCRRCWGCPSCEFICEDCEGKCPYHISPQEIREYDRENPMPEKPYSRLHSRQVDRYGHTDITCETYWDAPFGKDYCEYCVEKDGIIMASKKMKQYRVWKNAKRNREHFIGRAEGLEILMAEPVEDDKLIRFVNKRLEDIFMHFKMDRDYWGREYDFRKPGRHTRKEWVESVVAEEVFRDSLTINSNLEGSITIEKSFYTGFENKNIDIDSYIEYDSVHYEPTDELIEEFEMIEAKLNATKWSKIGGWVVESIVLGVRADDMVYKYGLRVSATVSFIKEKNAESLSAEGELERKYFARFGDQRGGKEWGEYNFTWFNDVGDWKPIDKDTTGWDEGDFADYREEKEYELVNQMLDNGESSLYRKIENNTTYAQEEEFNTTYKVLNEDGEVERLNLLISWEEPANVEQRIKYYDKEPLYRLEFLGESFGWGDHTCEHCGSTDIDFGNNWKCHDCGRYAAEDDDPSVYWWTKNALMEKMRDRDLTEGDLEHIITMVAANAPMDSILQGMSKAKELGDEGVYGLLKLAATGRGEMFTEDEIHSEKLRNYQAEEMKPTEGYIDNDGVFQHIGNQGLVSQELYDLENSEYDEEDWWACGICPHKFKVGDYYAIEDYTGEYFCATCSKDWETCEECEKIYDPEGEHMESCDNCGGEGWVMTDYDPGDRWNPPSADSRPCEECYDGKVCYLEAESFSADGEDGERRFFEFKEDGEIEYLVFGKGRAAKRKTHLMTFSKTFGKDPFSMYDKSVGRPIGGAVCGVTNRAGIHTFQWDETLTPDAVNCIRCSKYVQYLRDKNWLFTEEKTAESNKSIYQQAIDTIEARVADYSTHEDVSPYWGGGIVNPNQYLYYKLRYSWNKHPEDREEIIEQYMRGIEDGRIDPSNPLPHGAPNQHLPSELSAEDDDLMDGAKWEALRKSKRYRDKAAITGKKAYDRFAKIIAEGDGEKSAESDELEESKKRTKMSMIRTGLAITTFGIVLFNLWTNKKQEKDISDIMDLV